MLKQEFETLAGYKMTTYSFGYEVRVSIWLNEDDLLPEGETERIKNTLKEMGYEISKADKWGFIICGTVERDERGDDFERYVYDDSEAWEIVDVLNDLGYNADCDIEPNDAERVYENWCDDNYKALEQELRGYEDWDYNW